MILVDRTLDLASCARYGGDTLLARATEMLERLPGHTVDVGVDLARVFGMKDGGDSSSLVPGSLASPGVATEKEDEELESLVFSTEKECLNLLHKNLVEASPKKKTDSGKKFVTGSTLETLFIQHICEETNRALFKSGQPCFHIAILKFLLSSLCS